MKFKSYKQEQFFKRKFKISPEHEAAHFNELHVEGYSEQDQINDDYDQSEQDALDREQG